MQPENKYNLNIYQGSTFELTLTIKSANNTPKNLTSCSARMQIRPDYPSGVIAESLTSSNNEIVIDVANSEIYLSLPASRTANIPVDLFNGKPPKTIYVYDLELVDADQKVSKILYGDAYVYGEVTR